MYNFGNHISIPHTMIYFIKVTISMFYGKFADKLDNQVNNQNIYNVEGDRRLSKMPVY